MIKKQEFEFVKFKGESVNDIGIVVPEYFPAVKVMGSVQPVSNTEYQQLGIDFKQKAIRVWSFEKIDELSRIRGNDFVVWKNETYKAFTDEQDWHTQDGWVELVLISSKK